MRRSALWLGIGVGMGAAINDSAVAALVGVGIATAPWVALSILHVAGWVRLLWRSAINARDRGSSLRPEPMSSSEYDRFCWYGEVPERYVRREGMER